LDLIRPTRPASDAETVGWCRSHASATSGIGLPISAQISLIRAERVERFGSNPASPCRDCGRVAAKWRVRARSGGTSSAVLIAARQQPLSER
jgi:hypothetical protein